MIETLLAIIGVCLGFVLAVIFLIGDNIVLIFVIWWGIQLAKWIWSMYKDKNEKRGGK